MTNRKFTPPETFPAEYLTRDGRRAIIHARGNNKDFPLIGEVLCENGEWDGWRWTLNGLCCRNTQSCADLQDPPVRVELWMNCHEDRVFLYYTKEGAVASRPPHAIFTLKLSYDPASPGGDPQVETVWRNDDE